MLDDYFIATSTESRARANSLLPSVGSHENRGVLVRPTLPKSDDEETEDRDYLPTEGVDWYLHFRFKTIAQRSRILSALNPTWLERFNYPHVYGLAPRDGHWTYVCAGGVPEEYLELIVAWKLSVEGMSKYEPLSAVELHRYCTELQEALRPLGADLVGESSSTEAAAKRSLDLAALKAAADVDATLILSAPAGRSFDGKAIWDVMLSLGLEWGDMDLFHWANESSLGGDELFSVWTSTAPGYFLPEEIAASRVQTSDLVFGFSIPRSPSPTEVFANMLIAARYAQHRLGGKLLDKTGKSLDEFAIQSMISATVSILALNGFTPGESKSLYVF